MSPSRLSFGSVLMVCLTYGCSAPDPERIGDQTHATPISLDDKTYSVREFALNWIPKKNFGFAGETGSFLVAGGENGLTAINETAIFRYDLALGSFSQTILGETLGAAGRSFLPAAASTPSSASGLNFALFGGASFVEVTKVKGVRSDKLSVMTNGGASLFLGAMDAEGLSPRSGSCVAGLPGGDFFIFGGENLGTAVDGGVIFQSTKTPLPLPTSEAPPPRWAHGCVYNPGDGLIYIFGGLSNSGVSTTVFTFNRQTWRWGVAGDLNPAKFGFYNYALIGSRLFVIAEGPTNHKLEASEVSPNGVTPIAVDFPAGVFKASSLPYGAGETASPRQVGAFRGDCIVVPVTGTGGMPKLQEFCLQGSRLMATKALESLANLGIVAGIYVVSGSEFTIYVGSKSFYGDPLTGGRGLVLTKRAPETPIVLPFLPRQ